ncbi:MAG: dihydrofolate reductase [Alphaproteobacteria bacterium]|nr:MAG: dihydrofolate reductase [Alphaproteobacteria bacterium]
MTALRSKVTIHMAASLDGFIARTDGSTDWMEAENEFPDGESMDPEFVRDFLQSIDCYVMGSRTYETALAFDTKGLGWAYGDKPVFVLTTRALAKSRDTVELVSDDLTNLINERLRPAFRNIWIVGGSAVAGEAIRRGLADELRYSVLPVLIGDGIRFFDRLEQDVALHLLEAKAYKNGIVALRHALARVGSSQHGV